MKPDLVTKNIQILPTCDTGSSRSTRHGRAFNRPCTEPALGATSILSSPFVGNICRQDDARRAEQGVSSGITRASGGGDCQGAHLFSAHQSPWAASHPFGLLRWVRTPAVVGLRGGLLIRPWGPRPGLQRALHPWACRESQRGRPDSGS